LSRIRASRGTALCLVVFATQRCSALLCLDSFSRPVFSAFEHNQTKWSRQSQQACRSNRTTESYANHVCMLNVLFSSLNLSLEIARSCSALMYAHAASTANAESFFSL